MKIPLSLVGVEYKISSVLTLGDRLGKTGVIQGCYTTRDLCVSINRVVGKETP